MKLDNEILYTLKEIQSELKDELDEDLSIEEIFDVVQSQFTSTIFAFKKGVEVRLPFFGTFIRKYISQKVQLNVKLKEYKLTATPEEYKAKKARINAYNIRLSKQRKLNRRNSNITIEEFLAKPNLNKVIDKYKEL